MVEFNEAAHQAAMIAKAEGLRPTGTLAAVDAAAQADDLRAFRHGSDNHRSYQAPLHTTENTLLGTDLLATAKTASGSPVVGRTVSERDLVVYQGMEITVGHAIDLGAMYRDRSGNIVSWHEATEAPRENAPGESLKGPVDGEVFGGMQGRRKP